MQKTEIESLGLRRSETDATSTSVSESTFALAAFDTKMTTLRPVTPNTSCELEIALHDCHPLCMDGAEVTTGAERKQSNQG